MNDFDHAGGCHCGSIRWRFRSRHALDGFSPRACDCDFCTRHRAAWVSDPQGELRVDDRDGRLRRYGQGSGQARFLFCGRCGTLVAVTCIDRNGALRGAVNRNSFDDGQQLGVEVAASPQRLAADEKLDRWTQLWTPTKLS